MSICSSGEASPRRERAVLSALFHRTVDNLGKVRDGRNLHRYLRPRRGAIRLGIGKRTHLRVTPGVGWGVLINGVHANQIGKALGGRSGGVALHDTGLGVRCVCNANHGLKGFAFVVLTNIRGRYQLPHHVPELLRLLCLFLLLFRLLLRAQCLLFAGECEQPRGAYQRCQEQILTYGFHIALY